MVIELNISTNYLQLLLHCGIVAYFLACLPVQSYTIHALIRDFSQVAESAGSQACNGGLHGGCVARNSAVTS